MPAVQVVNLALARTQADLKKYIYEAFNKGNSPEAAVYYSKAKTVTGYLVSDWSSHPQFAYLEAGAEVIALEKDASNHYTKATQGQLDILHALILKKQAGEEVVATPRAEFVAAGEVEPLVVSLGSSIITRSPSTHRLGNRGQGGNGNDQGNPGGVNRGNSTDSNASAGQGGSGVGRRDAGGNSGRQAANPPRNLTADEVTANLALVVDPTHMTPESVAARGIIQDLLVASRTNNPGNAVDISLARNPNPTGPRYLNFNIPDDAASTRVVSTDAGDVRMLSFDQIARFFPAILVRDNAALLGEWRKSLAFKGFSPAEMATKLWYHKPTTSTIDDLMLMIVAGCERGNNIQNILRDAEEPLKSTLAATFSNYAVRANVQNVPSKMDIVTLSRVCLAFPHFTLEYYPDVVSPVVPWETLDAMLPQNVHYPRRAAHSAFGAFIPLRKDITKNLLGAHLLHQMLFSEIVNRGKVGSKRKNMSNCLNFVKAAYSSPFIPETAKMAWLRAWGLVNVDGGVSDEVSAAYSAFISYAAISVDDFDQLI